MTESIKFIELDADEAMPNVAKDFILDMLVQWTIRDILKDKDEPYKKYK
ncbi:MAG: hypothetical protein Q8R05_05010 [Candidatus Omnitrophota bacterium]|nr:hypothetical protein [Candidatus Omnitrophota bacterium]